MGEDRTDRTDGVKVLMYDPDTRVPDVTVTRGAVLVLVVQPDGMITLTTCMPRELTLRTLGAVARACVGMRGGS